MFNDIMLVAEVGHDGGNYANKIGDAIIQGFCSQIAGV